MVPYISVALRNLQPEDDPFVRRLYASTRLEEKELLGWDESQWEAFVTMQFTARQRSYQRDFPEADVRVIHLDEQPIGWFYVARSEAEIRVVDLALLPEWRGAGIGFALMRGLLAEAAIASKPVRCHVKRAGRERRFWERLGFVMIGDGPVHILMEWTPDSPEPAASPVAPGT